MRSKQRTLLCDSLRAQFCSTGRALGLHLERTLVLNSHYVALKAMPRKRFCWWSQISEAVALSRVSSVQTGEQSIWRFTTVLLPLTWTQTCSMEWRSGPESACPCCCRSERAVASARLLCDLQLCIVHREILFDPECDAFTESCLSVYSCVTSLGLIKLVTVEI